MQLKHSIETPGWFATFRRSNTPAATARVCLFCTFCISNTSYSPQPACTHWFLCRLCCKSGATPTRCSCWLDYRYLKWPECTRDLQLKIFLMKMYFILAELEEDIYNLPSVSRSLHVKVCRNMLEAFTYPNPHQVLLFKLSIVIVFLSCCFSKETNMTDLPDLPGSSFLPGWVHLLRYRRHTSSHQQ